MTRAIPIDPLVELLVADVIVHGAPRSWVRTFADARVWAVLEAARMRSALKDSKGSAA